MRRKFTATMVCGATVIACGSFDASPDDAQTDDAGADGGVVEGTPQPGAADASDAADAQTDAGGDGGAPGFTIESPDISVAAGDEAITCYYFHAPNGSDVMVKSFQSSLSSGIKHLALLFTASDRMAPGTVSATGCSMSPATADRPAWAYSTWSAQDGWSFPVDDGAGKPLGKKIKAGQSGYLLMHVQNSAGAPIKVRGTVNIRGYAAGTTVTQAESFVTYNSNINIPGQNSRIVTNTCPTPTGANFTWISTLSRRTTTHTYVKDGSSVVFDSTDFRNPGTRVWSQAPFGAFATNHVTVECDYQNTSASPVVTGDTPADETCMMLGYHFPATSPRYCVDDTLAP